MKLKDKTSSHFLYFKVFLFFCLFCILSNQVIGQTNAVVSGPTTVCPNNFHPSADPDKIGHDYSAQAFVLGLNATCNSWTWFVIKDGLAIASGFGNSLSNYRFTDVGQYTIRFFGNACGFFPFANVQGEIIVTSRVKMPSPITGPKLICNPGVSLTFQSDPSLDLSDPNCYYHYEYFWTAPVGWNINSLPSNTFFGHGTSASIVVPPNTPPGSYTISVQSTIPNGLPGPPPNNRFLSLPRYHIIQIGAFSSTQVTVSGTSGVCNGNSYTYTANLPGGHQSGYTYNWTFPSGWTVQSIFANTIRLNVPSSNNSYGPVRVSVGNGCGSPSPFSGITTFPGLNCSFITADNFKIYPNPSEGQLNVEYQLSADSKTNNDVGVGSEKSTNVPIEFSVELFDKDQNIVKTSQSVLGKVELITESLQPGTYFLHIHFGKEVIIKQIIVK